MTPAQMLSLLALGAIWGASFLFIRISAPVLGPLPVATGRVVIASIVLLIGLRLIGHRPSFRTHRRELFILSLLNAALPYALISAAEVHVTASMAAMLNATIPLWGTIVGVRWLGERVTVRRAAGLLLGLAGVATIVGWSPLTWSRTTVLSIGAMLVACISYAVAAAYAKRRLSGLPPATLALGQQLAATAWLAVPAIASLPAARLTAGAAGALLALGVVCTAGAYLLFFHLIASIGPTRTTSVAYLFPMFGALWGATFLDERVTAGMVAGFGIILVSVLLVNDVRFETLRRWSRRGRDELAVAPESCGRL